MRTSVFYSQDETVLLDGGVDYRNAVFRRCNLTYGGGNLQIEGAMFLDCAIAYTGEGERARDLQQAIFASLYAQGFRTLRLDKDGTYEAS